MISYRTKPEDPPKTVKVLGRGGTVRGMNKNWFNVIDELSQQKYGVDLGRVDEWHKLDQEENVNIVLVPRSQHGEERCIKAKFSELDKLKKFETYVEVDDLGQDRISTTWVLSIKGQEIRARLVARGFEELEDVPRESPTISRSSMRVLLAIAVQKKWKVKTTDIKSAFLQGKKLKRTVHLIPPKESETLVGKIWRLVRPLYGLNDASRQFYESISEFLLHVGCCQSKLDTALFMKYNKNNILIGCIGLHVDDFLHLGTIDFDNDVMEKLRDRFLAGKLEAASFDYIGFHIMQNQNSIVLDQTEYLKNCEIPIISRERAKCKDDPLTPKECTSLRSCVGSLNWAVQGTRPDKAFDMVELSTKSRSGKVSDLLRASKVMKNLKDDGGYMIFPDLGDTHNWKIFVFTDASFANLCDGVSSMGAFIVLLVGENSSCVALNWQGKKVKRVVKSTLEAEALSLQEGIEDAIYHRLLIEEVLKLSPRSLPVHGFVDNHDTVDAIYSTKPVTSKLLRINISSLKEKLQNKDVCDVQWCEGSEQLADCMTKKGTCGLQWLSVLQNGILE